MNTSVILAVIKQLSYTQMGCMRCHTKQFQIFKSSSQTLNRPLIVMLHSSIVLDDLRIFLVESRIQVSFKYGMLLQSIPAILHFHLCTVCEYDLDRISSRVVV